MTDHARLTEAEITEIEQSVASDAGGWQEDDMLRAIATIRAQSAALKAVKEIGK